MVAGDRRSFGLFAPAERNQRDQGWLELFERSKIEPTTVMIA